MCVGVSLSRDWKKDFFFLYIRNVFPASESERYPIYTERDAVKCAISFTPFIYRSVWLACDAVWHLVVASTGGLTLRSFQENNPRYLVIDRLDDESGRVLAKTTNMS